MKRLLVVSFGLVALAFPGAADAHPLGNFTVNRFSRVEVGAGHVYVRYALDLAEIPTLQAGTIDSGAYATRIASRLRLRLNGRPARLVVVASRLAQPEGSAGLRTTRLDMLLRGPLLERATRVEYRDSNFPGRLGWKEVVVGDAPSRSLGLRAYPRDARPLEVTAVTTTLGPEDGSAAVPTLSEGAAARGEPSGFEGLVRHDLSAGFVLISIALALFWGAVHALGPGHGKAIVAGYLVGSRGSARHAVLLGLVVTVTHTIGVFALGLVTLALSEFLLPEQLYPWLNLAAALLVVLVGAGVLRSRLGGLLHTRAHARGHQHDHDHAHSHRHESGLRGLVGVGVSGGLLPCPTALVVLLAAISLHRVGYGLALIVAFSIGLAATVTGIGLVAVTAKRVFSRANLDGPIVRALPTVSALVVLALGVAMTARALPQLV